MKQHYHLTRDPITKWNRSIEVLCGAEIFHPEATCMNLFAPDLMRFPEIEENIVRDCIKCVRMVKAEIAANEGKRLYIYGLIPAQEAKIEESDCA